MNTSERKALAVIHERAAASTWATTHAEASLAAGLRERTWRRAIGSLVEFKLVSLKATKNGVILSVKGGHFEDGHDGQDGHSRTARVATTDTEDGQDGQKEGKGEYKPSLTDSRRSSFASNKQLTTNDEQTTVAVKTARGEGGQDGQNEGGQDGHDGQLRTATFWQAALRLARDNGRLEAENAHLRERLARLETPCPTPAPLPIHSTSAPPAVTRGNATPSPATGPTSGPPLSSTSSGSTWTPTVTPTAPATEPRPSAPHSPPAALHPANRRDDPLPPAPSSDDAEDQRLFLELAKEHGLSEQAAETELLRAWSIGRPLHEAVAAVWLIRESGGELGAPWAYLWAALNRANKYPLPEGVASRWSEIKGPWLAVAKARNKKREAKAAKAEAKASADYPMNLDRPLVRVLSEKAKAEGW